MADKNNVLESVREDDFIEYYLFPFIETSDYTEQEIILSKLLKDIEKIIRKHSQNYLWHKDEFKLVARTNLTNKLVDDNGKSEYLPPHLYGISHFGDNIEDEWFIVYLLQELTRQINGLIVRVFDSDGEFLLIEAADYLPTWVNPETSENRVYFYEGNIHLIEPEDDDLNPDDQIMAVNEAVSIIRTNSTDTLASKEMQNSIINKIKDYPGKIKEHLHRTTVYVPVGVAAILKHKPNLIAPAIHVFCNRDSVDVKACNAMKYFPPENRVNTSVTFTKCLYAMLSHSKYVPDRRTGWNLPSITSPQYKAHNLGVKIACGFEILISQAKPSADIEQDKGWHKYLNSLKDKKYFNDLLEHSRDYNNLLNKAKEYYINHRDSMQYTPIIGQEILNLTKTLDYKTDELKKEEKHLPKDDDDSWLNISSDELDKLLQEQYGEKKFVTVNNNSDAANFTEKISKFLNHMSDVDGAEFPDINESPIRPPRGVKCKSKNKVSFSDDTKTETKSSTNKIDFDPNSFASAVQNILNFVIPEDDNWDLESDSDMSDYAEDNYINEKCCENDKNKMEKYMEEMDKELAATSIGDSFEKMNGDNFDDIESFKPVDIDMNALKNILESYKSQLGEAGPSTNMLGPMGIHLDSIEYNNGN